MKNQFWLLHRNSVFYLKNSLTCQKTSLHTRNRREALRLRAVHNKAAQSSALGLAFAKAYLSAHDPDFAKRTWQQVMDCFCAHGKPQTQEHRKRIASHRHFDRIRSKTILETNADDFFKILRVGGVMVHTYLHCLQSLALGLNWLPWPILPNKLWPVHRAYAKKAHVILPSLEEYERANQPLLPLFAAELPIPISARTSAPAGLSPALCR